MQVIDLTRVFDREVEILEVGADTLVYASDCREDEQDACVIGVYHTETATREEKLTLDDTRLYESFRTFGCLNDFFYAVNVLDDYKVHLQKIDKQTWKKTEEAIVTPEGEILNIWPLNDQYALVTDEVTVTPETKKTYGLEACNKGYETLVYLYDLAEHKKSYITDAKTKAKLLAMYQEPEEAQEAFSLEDLRIQNGYKEVIIEDEPVFYEVVTMENTKTGETSEVHGRAGLYGDKIIITKSFLVL